MVSLDELGPGTFRGQRQEDLQLVERWEAWNGLEKGDKVRVKGSPDRWEFLCVARHVESRNEWAELYGGPARSPRLFAVRLTDIVKFAAKRRG